MEGRFSGPLDLCRGVPQGSILGPLLFLIYINDLGSQFGDDSIFLYADDTNVLIDGPDHETLVNNVNVAINKISEWFNQNKLVVNKKKTNIMNFRTSRDMHVQHVFNFDGVELEYTDEAKFLGITLDVNLSWRPHIAGLSKKLSSACFLLRVLSTRINKNVLKLVYYANFHSHLAYGVPFWGQGEDWLKIFVLQKRAMRILHGVYRDPDGQLVSCRGIFKSSKILTLPCMYILNCVILTISNRDRINYLVGRATRNDSVIMLPRHRLSLYERNVFYCGSKFYNALPREMRIKPLPSFKKDLKNFLAKEGFYTVEEFLNKCSAISRGTLGINL